MSAIALDRRIEPAATGAAVIQCAWCGRLKRHGSYSGRGLPIVHVFNGHSVSHGICPECHAKLEAREAVARNLTAIDRFAA